MRGEARWGAPRSEVVRGRVVGRDADDDFGAVLRVETVDGRRLDCQPWYPGAIGEQGGYDPIPDGAAVLVFLPNGDPSGAVCVSGFPTSGSQCPSDVGTSSSERYGLLRHHATAGDTVEGVVLRPLLDDLRAALADLRAVMVALTNPATPPGTAAQNAAILTAMRTAAATIVANLDTLNANLDTSRAGSGTAPYCSGVLRAHAGGS